MSLKDKLRDTPKADGRKLYRTYGVAENPFPTSNQTSGNPHYSVPEDEEAEDRLATFFREGRSEVLVVLGTQGVGKTNFLNYLENEILEAKADSDDHYVVRYMADPEPSFDGIIRTVLQELGPSHLRALGKSIRKSKEPLRSVKSFDLRAMLVAVSKDPDDEQTLQYAMEWLLGFRLLNAHRNSLDVSFRLDTVESRTSVLRDYIVVSVEAGLLKGIILLLDELEKQAGVLGPTAVVRYLSAMRAIIDSLPKYLFLIIAVTPDAMRRYSSALPAFRSRLENQTILSPLQDFAEAAKLADFYQRHAREAAARTQKGEPGARNLVDKDEMREAFDHAQKSSQRRGDEGVRQREFLNTLHRIAEAKIQALSGSG